MKTVNSLSGGRTSSFLALNYPTDINIFSLVCIDCHNAMGWLKRDKKAVQYVNDKLSKFIPQYGEFRATAEDPMIIYTMMDLEQKLGKEITWVRGVSFETLINIRKALPNKYWRFCTTEMKMRPIFEYCYLNLDMPVEMSLGIRYDELERAEKINDEFKFAYSSNLYGQNRMNWKTIKWRTNKFRLIDDKIIHYHIKEYWNINTDVRFAEDSNCQMCFHKQPQQLRKNFDNNSQIMFWGSIQETIKGNSFRDDMTLLNINKIGLQVDFSFGTGSGCNSGECLN